MLRIPTITLGNGAQVRTLACGLPLAIATFARNEAAELEGVDDPEKVSAKLAEVCGAIKDATRCALALDELHGVLVNTRKALDNDPTHELIGEPVREARELRIHREAVRRCAPELEVPDTDNLSADLHAAMDRVAEARESGWAMIREATRALTWTMDSAIRRSHDVGAGLRVLARAGLLPVEVDRNLAFAAVPDHEAPQGSPAHNSAVALHSLVLHEARAQADCREDAELTTRQLVARITEICREEERA